jgi:PIN domain nuclease of toxin-antitoxin system
MKFVLDTHAWIWWNIRPAALSRKVRSRLAEIAEDDQFLVPAIAVWECCQLIESGRLVLNISAEDWISAALTLPRLSLAPLTQKIALASTHLPDGFEGDAVDRLIVATTRAENAALITGDERLA